MTDYILLSFLQPIKQKRDYVAYVSTKEGSDAILRFSDLFVKTIRAFSKWVSSTCTYVEVLKFSETFVEIPYFSPFYCLSYHGSVSLVQSIEESISTVLLTELPRSQSAGLYIQARMKSGLGDMAKWENKLQVTTFCPFIFGYAGPPFKGFRKTHER